MPEPFPLSLPFSCCPEHSSLIALGGCCGRDAAPGCWCMASPRAFPTVPLGQRGEHTPPRAWQRRGLSLGQVRRDQLPAPLLATLRGASCTTHVGSAEALSPAATSLSITAGSAPSALRLGSSWTFQPINSAWIWRLAAGNLSHCKL